MNHTAVRSYVKQMAANFRYYATWLPTVPLTLGDYGVMEERYRFRKLGNIEDLGFKFDEFGDKSQNAIDFQTSGAVTVDTSIEGEVPALAGAPVNVVDLEAKVAFKFNRKHSVVFKANGVVNRLIRDQPKLGREIMERFRQKEWDKSWKVITSLVDSDSATIIIANSKGSELTLAAKGDIGINEVIDIANAGVNFMVTHKSDMAYVDIAKEGLTPLFEISGIKTTLGFNPRYETLAFRGAADPMDAIPADEILANPDQFVFGADEFPILREAELE